MKFAILGAVIAATVLGALPASAEVVVRAGGNGIAVGERHHNEGWRNHHAECRTVRTRTVTPSGRVIIKTRRSC
jgi:hypothetical protein